MAEHPNIGVSVFKDLNKKRQIPYLIHMQGTELFLSHYVVDGVTEEVPHRVQVWVST